MESDAVDGAEYTIVVRGELDPRFAPLFNGMEMGRTGGKTVIKGRVVDQAQLHGFIERCEELGLELLSVEQTQALAEQDERKGKA
jgi:hypothetical protein